MPGEIRRALIASGIALFLSILSALAGGVPFGDFLIRALVTVLLTGGLSILVMKIIEKFLPDLISKEPSSTTQEIDGAIAGGDKPSSEDGAQQIGSQVNIVMPGGNEPQDTEVDSTPMESESEVVGMEAPETIESADAGPVEELTTENEAEGTNVQEAAAWTPGAFETGSAAKMNNEDEVEDEDNSEPDLVQEVNEDGAALANMAQSAVSTEGEFYEGVESLPDIAGFEDTFQSNQNVGMLEGNEEEGGELVQTGAEDDNIAPSYSEPQSQQRDGMDPKEIAKAIQTALKKG